MGQPIILQNLSSNLEDLSPAHGNADETGTFTGSSQDPVIANTERRGNKNRRTAPKTGENTGDDSPSVRKRKSRFPYVQQSRHKGKLYLRFRRKGYPNVTLPGPIGSPQFIQTYAAALTRPAIIPQQQPRPAPVPKENTSGQWVYIIAYGKRDFVKIGTTTKPKQRLASLRATSIESLEVLAHFPGGRELERRLHELFAEQRAWNEFFRRDELLDRFLRNIEFRSLPDAIAHIEAQKVWLRKPESERRAIERKRSVIERKRGLVPIYPDEWNEARLEANRQKQRERSASPPVPCHRGGAA